MPIYEYACMECEEHFDELVRSEQQVVTCPSCGAAKVLKQLSSFAVHGTASKPSFASGSGGGWLLRRLLRLRSLTSEAPGASRDGRRGRTPPAGRTGP